jgi:DNA polymerase elongation subunit (family B)
LIENKQNKNKLILIIKMEHIFRVFDYNVYNSSDSSRDSDEENVFKDNNIFMIQMFGVDEYGKTCSVVVDGFKPFFYVMVDDSWTIQMKEQFITHLKEKMGKYYRDSITDSKIIRRKKLYGFDNKKEHKFIFIEFANLNAFNKAKNLWYSDYQSGHKLLKNGYSYFNTDIKLYEANIPPLLRFFHIKDMSPSGWIAIPKKKVFEFKDETKTVNCDYQFSTNIKNIIPLNDKETRVPYKIMSFDIEASSSHGDFPVPIKTYKKLATNIVEYFEDIGTDQFDKKSMNERLTDIVLSAFGYGNVNGIDLVYPKKHPGSKEDVLGLINKWLDCKVRSIKKTEDFNEANTLESMFEKLSKEVDAEVDEDGEKNEGGEVNMTFESHANKVYNKYVKEYSDKKATIVDILLDKKYEREGKLNELNISLNSVFPKLQGDKVTFIGSTFMNYGNKDPHLNHCIVLNTCSNLPMENSVIESYKTEKEVLMAWQQLVQKENPDIIIGYNIFGFDYEFMFRRAEENGCVEEFLKLSRNKDEICGTKDKESGKYRIEESSIQLASGQHDLRFIKINGRLQVDLYNFYRRGENLTSYKLDYVAGYFIGDFVKKLEHNAGKTTIYTNNLTGLLIGSNIHFEEIGHSVDYYSEGAKYLVTSIDKVNCKFEINSIVNPDFNKKVRWCLAKDDVTPKDIFNLTNGNADDRAIVAKYCIQDCNLVHYLFNKSDVLTGFIEMAKICSVPINFLVMRGQGIKLQSLIANECRKIKTLIPVIEKGDADEGYEGAIVLPPKCDLYLDNPVACNDYASLYPSSMISENLSHDSKVWTQEFDLAGNMIEEWGYKDENGNYLYDNLPGYEYVNVEYDTYRYFRKHPKAAAEKIKCGYKICRFAQPQGEGESAIMPAILKKLLKARKDTRKMIPNQSDEFMKQVLEQRQLGYKVTANSLYGGCGAKTSSFYEKDIAACTTAMGRKFLTYGKRIVEECYKKKICQTKNHGLVLTNAEYIYGDSVANYTPIYVRINNNIELLTIEQLAKKYGNDEWVFSKEDGKQEKEFCEVKNVETWTEKGWTKLYRVIRHKLASHKKMIRILTHTGLVDVTDDHSLIKLDGTEISPKDISIGTELLHNNLPKNEVDSSISIEEAQIMGFFFGDGSCGLYDCPSGKKSSWALNNASQELINKYLNLCKKVYSSYDWVVMPTLESSGVYKISPRNNNYGKIVEFVNHYRNLLYFNKNKIIPNEILNGTTEIKLAFFNGLYDADGDKDINGYKRIDQKSQLSASNICLLAQSLGYSTSINIRKDKPEIYRITMTKKTQRKNPNAIKKFIEIKYEGYVYDLTTENHHFAAGIGNLIVHNTDSVFYTFNLQDLNGNPIRGKDALEITIELAQEAGEIAAKFLKPPHDFEYEKTFMPFCLLSKKRYVGMLYEKDPNKCKRKEMGIVLKRRDNAPIVKDIYGGIIDILMKKQNIQEAIQFLRNSLQNIVDEKYPIDKLVITKSLRSGYKNPKSIAHKVLADRITARDPGNKPGPGDRIPFAYISVPGKKVLQGDKIETPSFILENNLKLDYSFYITNQIMKPIQQLFALVVEKIWEMQNKRPKLLKYKKEIEQIRRDLMNEYEDDEKFKEKFEDKVEQIRCKEIKSLLFDEYLRETNNEKAGVQSITNFFAKK